MKSFKDNAGRSWDVTITVGTVKRVRNLLDIDLYKVCEKGMSLLAEIVDDPCKLCDVLFAICYAQAAEANVSDEQFGEALGGDALSDAAEAFIEALIDFFPQARVRDALKKVIAKSEEVRDRILTQAETTINELNPDKEAENLMKRLRANALISNNTFTSSPVSSV